MGVILLRFASSTARVARRFPMRCRNGDGRFWTWRLRGRALRRASKPAVAVLLLALDRRSLAPKPFHPDTRSEHADGQQRNELAPADGAAHLNCAAQHFGVEPKRVPARCQCQLGLLNRSSARPQTRNGGDDRRQQEKTRERYGRGQRTVPSGQPNECDQEDEAGGEDAEYNGKERPNEKAGAQADL